MGKFIDIMEWEKYLNPFPKTYRRSRASEFLYDLRDRITPHNWVTGVLYRSDDRGCLLGHIGAMLMSMRDPRHLTPVTVERLIRANEDAQEAIEILAIQCIQKTHPRWAQAIQEGKAKGQWTLHNWCVTIATYNDSRRHCDEIKAIISSAIEFIGDESGLRYYDRRRMMEREPLPSFAISAISEGGEYPPLTPAKKVEPDPAERVEIPSWDPDAELADLLKDKELVAA